MRLSTWEKGNQPDTHFREVEIDGAQFELCVAPMIAGMDFGDCIWMVWKEGLLAKAGKCEGLALAKGRAEVTAILLSGEELLSAGEVA